MSYEIVFKTEADMPLLPMSLGSTLYNKTGSWRYVRPIYRDKTSPCNHACPAGEDIVTYLAMVTEGQYEQARQTILQENPFPGVCGRVCAHPCESECNRAQLGGAIAIHSMERFLADLPAPRALPRLEQRDVPDARVAVIGSGPAGLSCAYQLVRSGYEVTVFEALPAVGGMLRVGIPSYRLPRDVLNAEIEGIVSLGIEIRTGMRFGEDLGFEDLTDYRAVFLAVGQQRSLRLNVPGEDASGVTPGVQFLRQVNLGQEITVGPTVAVIGGGNTAMDAARSALRLGASDVAVLYRRSRHEMPAIPDEVEEAEQEGIRLEFLTAPVEVLTENGRVRGLRCVRMRLGAPDESGRRRPEVIPGSDYTVDVDMVIPALGQEADLSFLGDRGQVERGRIAINEAGVMSRSPSGADRSPQGVFAGGDAATGFGTVAHAIGSGKRAALAIDRYLRGQALEGFPPLTAHLRVAPRDVDPTVVRFEDINLAYFSEEPRTVQRQRPAAERIKGFGEVNLGYSEGDALKEAERCFSCGVCNQCDTCWLFCPDVCIHRLDSGAPSAAPGRQAYEVDYDYCKGCGVCAEECPRAAIVMEEELKWRK